MKAPQDQRPPLWATTHNLENSSQSMPRGITHIEDRQAAAQIGANTQVRALSLEDSILKTMRGPWGDVCRESQDMCASTFMGTLSLFLKKKKKSQNEVDFSDERKRRVI